MGVLNTWPSSSQLRRSARGSGVSLRDRQASTRHRHAHQAELHLLLEAVDAGAPAMSCSPSNRCRPCSSSPAPSARSSHQAGELRSLNCGQTMGRSGSTSRYLPQPNVLRRRLTLDDNVLRRRTRQRIEQLRWKPLACLPVLEPQDATGHAIAFKQTRFAFLRADPVLILRLDVAIPNPVIGVRTNAMDRMVMHRAPTLNRQSSDSLEVVRCSSEPHPAPVDMTSNG